MSSDPVAFCLRFDVQHRNFRHFTKNIMQSSRVIALLILVGVLSCNANDITDGLIGYYPFSGNVVDASGNGNNGTIVGTPQLVNDRFGTPNAAYHFSQGVNRVQLHNLPVNLAPGAETTVSFWMKWDGSFYDPNDVGAFPFVWGGWAGSSDGAHGTVYLTGNQSWYPSDVQTRLGLNGLAGHGETYGLSNPSGLSDWMQVVAVFKNGDDLREGKLFINGQQISADLFSAAGPDTLITSWVGANPAIGGLNNDSDRYQFIGDLDDVRIYDRGLSQSDALALYNSESQNVPDNLSTLTAFGVGAIALFFFNRRRACA